MPRTTLAGRRRLTRRVRRGAAVAALAVLLAGCGAALPGSESTQSLALAAPAPVVAETDEIEDVPSEPPLAIPAEPGQPDAPLPLGTRALTAAQDHTATFTASRDSEGVLALTARGVGTDWAAAGRESAVVTVYLDGKYNQDIILSRGEPPAVYRALLGPIASGEHRLDIRYRPDLSPSGARGAEIVAARAEARVPGDPDYDAIAGSPVIYARPEANRSDTPLFLTYERLATGLRYTMYVSNEDGGTPAADLMAVWGRACDIDWVYRQSGTGQGGYIQGFLHRQLAFRGRFEARHPVLRVSSWARRSPTCAGT